MIAFASRIFGVLNHQLISPALHIQRKQILHFGQEVALI
jgi:hypothetical protein